jgi:hypothetical protein
VGGAITREAGAQTRVGSLAPGTLPSVKRYVPQLVHCLRDEDIIFVRQRAILALLVSLEEPELVPYVEQVSLHLRRRLTTEVTHQNFPCLVSLRPYNEARRILPRPLRDSLSSYF